MRQSINGILLLDKPANMTSNGALQRVKRLFNAKKAGHTGSLDPLATGMLPLCFGEATKFSQFLLDSDKSYHVVARLGIETATGDREGEVTVVKPVVNVTPDKVEQAMLRFCGEIDQIPPMYSALKMQGEPLYKLARKGIEVERQPRRITIFSLTMESLMQDKLVFSVHCSKGTYVRTLVEDIGRVLGCGAHVEELRRLTVTPYGDTPMHTMEKLELFAKEGLHKLMACLMPVETSVQIYPAIKLSTAAAFYLRQGQPVRVSAALNTSLVRLLSEDARFLGVGEMLEDGRVKPHRLLAG